MVIIGSEHDCVEHSVQTSDDLCFDDFLCLLQQISFGVQLTNELALMISGVICDRVCIDLLFVHKGKGPELF